MTGIENLRDTIIPKSDQMNADELIAGPREITITAVRRGDGEQPICVDYEGGEGKPWKPCKTVRKILIHAWSEDGRQWVGKRARLYLDPEVTYGGVKVGGVRVSHLSGIENDLAIALTTKRGRREVFKIGVLRAAKPAATQNGAGKAEVDAAVALIRAAATMADLEIAYTAGIAAAKLAGFGKAEVVAAKDACKEALLERDAIQQEGTP